jgi:ABC-type Fe3+ transport system permease subunit
VLGTVAGRLQPIVWGMVLAPLLIPPQIYAYAWELASGPHGVLRGALPTVTAAGPWGGSVRAGLISAGWLWPIVAMIVGAGWRSTGRSVYAMAILDTRPSVAYLRVVLPALRHHLMAGACLVFAVAMIEYAIPHLTLSRVWATEMLLLVDAGAPPRQILGMAGQVMLVVLAVLAGAAVSLRATADWQVVEVDDMAERAGRHLGAGRLARAGFACVWLMTVGLPVVAMAASLRRSTAWTEAVTLFAREWTVSLAVAAGAGLLSVMLAAATMMMLRASGRPGLRWASGLCFLAAMVPPAALGVGFITVFNQPGPLGTLYDRTPVVWCLSLVGRYGAVAVLIAWLALGRRSIAAVEQARVDGATSVQVLGYVLLPMLGPTLAAAGLIVMLLSLFEVVVTHLAGPVGYPSLALTLLNHMHYGRDDVVIATSLAACAGGLVLTMVCGWLLVRPERL